MPSSPAITSSLTRNRSTSASLPQCSTLLVDGTQCTLRGTHGNPEKPQRRCKTHNELYQDMYFAYKVAGEQVSRVRAAFGRMPDVEELKWTYDIGLIERLQSFLNLYRVVVENELMLREAHTEQFMLTLDEGHLAWHARCRQERDTIDNVLKWLRQRKLELLTPPPLPQSHRPRSASSAISITPALTSQVHTAHQSPKVARRHKRGQSEPTPTLPSMDSQTVFYSSPPVHSPALKESIGPQPQKAVTAMANLEIHQRPDFICQVPGRIATTSICVSPSSRDASQQPCTITPHVPEPEKENPPSSRPLRSNNEDQDPKLYADSQTSLASQTHINNCDPTRPQSVGSGESLPMLYDPKLSAVAWALAAAIVGMTWLFKSEEMSDEQKCCKRYMSAIGSLPVGRVDSNESLRTASGT